MENIPGEQTIFDYIEDPNPVVKKKKKRPVNGITTIDHLNVREDPDADSDVLAILDKDTIVTIIDESDPEYYKVFANRVSGFCVKKYIKKI